MDVLPTLIKTTNIPQIRQFIGRIQDLDNLRERLASDSIYERVAVLQGPAGIGKTHLAVKYADEFHKEYKAIIWLDASSPLRLLTSFSNAKDDIEKVESLEDIENESHLTRSIESIEHSLKRLRYFKKLRDEHTGWENYYDSWKTLATFEDVRLVKRWLGSMKTTGWLLVFDDYQPPTDVKPSEAGDPIEYFFPENLRNGHIVITTQSNFERWHSIALGKINCDQEGLDIILSNIRRRRDIPKGSYALASKDFID